MIQKYKILRVSGMPAVAVVVGDVPVQCSLADAHYGRVLYEEISTAPANENALEPGCFLLQSTDGKLFCLNIGVLKLASPVLAAYVKGLLLTYSIFVVLLIN